MLQPFVSRNAVCVPLVWTFSLIAALPFSAFAQSLDALLNAPAWRVDFDVAIKADSTRPYEDGRGGTGTIRTTVDSAFSASKLIDLRSDGPNLIFDMSHMTALQSGAAPSPAEAIRMAQAMLEAMEGTANWMSTGLGEDAFPDDPDASPETIVAAGLAALRAQATPARLAYEQTVDADTQDEFGDPYHFTNRVAAKGAANVLVGSGGATDVLFQLETRANKYRMTLPIIYRGDITEAKIEVEENDRTQFRGEEPVENHTESSREFTSGYLSVRVDDPQYFLDPAKAASSTPTDSILIVADLDVAGGKLAGERTIPVHVGDGGVAGTMTVRYTLTPVSQ
jgi:hypothetical protein